MFLNVQAFFASQKRSSNSKFNDENIYHKLDFFSEKKNTYMYSKCAT